MIALVEKSRLSLFVDKKFILSDEVEVKFVHGVLSCIIVNVNLEFLIIGKNFSE